MAGDEWEGKEEKKRGKGKEKRKEDGQRERDGAS